MDLYMRIRLRARPAVLSHPEWNKLLTPCPFESDRFAILISHLKQAPLHFPRLHSLWGSTLELIFSPTHDASTDERYLWLKRLWLEVAEGFLFEKASRSRLFLGYRVVLELVMRLKMVRQHAPDRSSKKRKQEGDGVMRILRLVFTESPNFAKWFVGHLTAAPKHPLRGPVHRVLDLLAHVLSGKLPSQKPAIVGASNISNNERTKYNNPSMNNNRNNLGNKSLHTKHASHGDTAQSTALCGIYDPTPEGLWESVICVEAYEDGEEARRRIEEAITTPFEIAEKDRLALVFGLVQSGGFRQISKPTENRLLRAFMCDGGNVTLGAWVDHLQPLILRWSMKDDGVPKLLWLIDRCMQPPTTASPKQAAETNKAASCAITMLDRAVLTRVGSFALLSSFAAFSLTSPFEPSPNVLPILHHASPRSSPCWSLSSSSSSSVIPVLPLACLPREDRSFLHDRLVSRLCALLCCTYRHTVEHILASTRETTQGSPAKMTEKVNVLFGFINDLYVLLQNVTEQQQQQQHFSRKGNASGTNDQSKSASHDSPLTYFVCAPYLTTAKDTTSATEAVATSSDVSSVALTVMLRMIPSSVVSGCFKAHSASYELVQQLLLHRPDTPALLACCGISVLSLFPLLCTDVATASELDEEGSEGEEDGTDEDITDEQAGFLELLDRCRELLKEEMATIKMEKQCRKNEAGNADQKSTTRMGGQGLDDSDTLSVVVEFTNIIPELILDEGAGPANGMVRDIAENLWKHLCTYSSDNTVLALTRQVAGIEGEGEDAKEEEGMATEARTGQMAGGEVEEDESEDDVENHQQEEHEEDCERSRSKGENEQDERRTPTSVCAVDEDDEMSDIGLTTEQTLEALLEDNEDQGPKPPRSDSSQEQRRQRHRDCAGAELRLRSVDVLRVFMTKCPDRSVSVQALCVLFGEYRKVVLTAEKKGERTKAYRDLQRKYCLLMESQTQAKLCTALTARKTVPSPPLRFIAEEKGGQTVADGDTFAAGVEFVKSACSSVLSILASGSLPRHLIPPYMQLGASILAYLFKLESSMYLHKLTAETTDVPSSSSSPSSSSEFPLIVQDPSLSICTMTLTKAALDWAQNKKCRLSSAFFSFFASRYPVYCRFVEWESIAATAWKGFILRECRGIGERVAQHPATFAPYAEIVTAGGTAQSGDVSIRVMECASKRKDVVTAQKNKQRR
eukprot:GHVS01103130.1.p1 GENE.GHVS01103130.1~~GHVS01103130.1.p1  ORF type:complete len:1330 (-),score=200.57 GHVS01103130.1:47-3631(-)